MGCTRILKRAGLTVLSLTMSALVACASPDGMGPDLDGGVTAPVASGTIDVRVLDQPLGSVVHYRLTNADGTRVKLLFETDPLLRSGAEVDIRGTWLDDHTLSVTSWSRVSEEKRLDNPLVRTKTHHRVAILAMQQASVQEADALRAANGTTASLRHFMAETTRGIDTFSGDIFRRYNIAYTASDCLYENSDRLWDAMVAAFLQDGNDPSDYDHIAVIVPRSCGSDWSGAWASVGGIRDNGGIQFEQTSVYKDDAFDAWFLAHELGHNMGMHHSQSINCGTPLYNKDAVGCSVEEYGNYNDVMGWGEGVYWGTPHQRFMGWIAPDRVVTAGQSATFNLQSADGSSCGISALRIPVPAEPGVYFYVEYRRARTDSLYAGTGAVGGSRSHAVLITRSRDGVDDQSNNQRLELGTPRYEGARIGTSYALGADVAVEVLSMGGAFASVKVRMPGTGSHRRDDGGAVTLATNGGVGPSTCSGVPEPDACPSDPNKTVPGLCGCGVPEGSCGGNTPTISMAKASFTTPEAIVVNYANLTGASDWVGIYAAGAANSNYLQYLYASTSSSGTMSFSPRAAGNYQARLFLNDSYTLVTSVPFTVTATQVDGCPSDPAKTAPGVCGCGVSDVDGDGDGTADCKDGCPSDKSKVAPGVCGCGVAEGSCGGTMPVRYEAEARSAASGCTLASSHAGFTGTGFMDYGGNGTWIEWNTIAAPQAGEYTLALRYANASSANRTASILINGVRAASAVFAPSGGWARWRTETIVVSLRQGNNTIRVLANSSAGGPNLDHAVVTARQGG